MALIHDLDSYGKYERVTALADAWELSALAGKSYSIFQITDYILDRGWANKDLDFIIDPGSEDALPAIDALGGETSQELDQIQNFTRQVLDVVARRAEIIKALYPFILVNSRLEVRADFDLPKSSYCQLLCLTGAHSFEEDLYVGGFIPHQVFEDVVSQFLSGSYARIANMGELSRTHKKFPLTLESAATILRTSCNTNAPQQKFANEEGCDVVALSPFHDNDARPSQIVIAVQATCGQSTSWKYKSKEVVAGKWKTFFNLTMLPTKAFAVPHQISYRMMSYLVAEGDHNILLIDRLRLAKPTPYDFAASQVFLRHFMTTSVLDLD